MTKDKRLLLVGPQDGIGGHVTYVKDVVRFGFAGFNTDLFNTSRKKKLARRNKKTESLRLGLDNAVDVFSAVGVTFGHIVKFGWRIVVRRPRVVLITGGRNVFWEQVVFILLCRVLQIKVVLHYHGPLYLFFQYSSPQKQKAVRLFYGMLDKIFVLSQVDREKALTFLPPHKVSLVPNYISAEEYPLVYQDKTSSRDGIVRVFFLGGGSPQRKGLGDVVAAINAMPVMTRVRFLLSGSDDVRKAAESEVLPDRRSCIDCLGWISEGQKRELYETADILLLPSYDEGLPYVLIEAMACGMAVISTRVGGIPDLLPSHEHGLIISPGDVEMLKNSLLRLIQDPELCRTMGRNNIERIKKFYRQDDIFTQMETELSHAVGV